MEFKYEIELTPGQRLLCNVIAGVYLVACGILLLLVGVGAIGGVSVSKIWLPTVLLTLGLIFLTTGLIQGNVVSVWLSIAFITPAVISYLAGFTSLTYGQLYPFYIAIPALCSLVTMALSRKAVKDHLKVILFFGVIALFFALKSFSLVGWSVTLPGVLVFVGLIIILTAIKNKKEK